MPTLRILFILSSFCIVTIGLTRKLMEFDTFNNVPPFQSRILQLDNSQKQLRLRAVKTYLNIKIKVFLQVILLQMKGGQQSIFLVEISVADPEPPLFWPELPLFWPELPLFWPELPLFWPELPVILVGATLILAGATLILVRATIILAGATLILAGATLGLAGATLILAGTVTKLRLYIRLSLLL